MSNLTRYLTQNQLTSRVSLTTTFSQATLNKAEADIDNLISVFVQGDYRKAIIGSSEYTCTMANTTATLASFNASDGYYDRVTLEILSGDNSGSRFAVKSQVGSTLTFWEATSITGEVKVAISQYPKAPFWKDMRIVDDKYYKVIDERIQQAVALQYLFREKNDKGFGNSAPIQSKSLNNAGYSFTYDTSKTTGLIDRIHPDAYELIADLTVQTYV